MRGVFLHLMADALGSVIVIISALIIWLTDWEFKMYVDPLLSVIMVVIILSSVWPLRKSSLYFPVKPFLNVIWNFNYHSPRICHDPPADSPNAHPN